MKKNRFFGLAGMVSLALTFAFVLAVGMAFVGCATDGGKTPEVNGGETPVEHPDAKRWKTESEGTATIQHSVDSDGICAITVGGTPEEG